MMRIISYNLLENKAGGELLALANHDLDMLCLQEADTSLLPAELGNLYLADSTKRNRLGLAVYYRRERFTAVDTKAFALKKSMHDFLMKPSDERLIGTKLVHNETDRELIVASFHAAPLSASNRLRREQIRAAHEHLRVMGDVPTIMVGDYNYPLFHRRLSRTMEKTGYELSLSDRRTYGRYLVVRGRFDFATSIGLKVESVETLGRGASDHIPILVTASWR